MRRAGLLMFATLAGVGSLAAQGKGIDRGTFEIGIFGRYNKFPDVFQISNATSDRFGGGGRIGYFFARNFALELDGSSNPFDLTANQPLIPATFGFNSRPVIYSPFHLQLVYNVPISNRFQWLIGAGANDTRLSRTVQESDVGFGGMTGLRWRALHSLSFRLEGTADIVPSGFAGKSNTYLGAQLGLSFLLGGKGCDHAMDMINIVPTSATLQPGQSQTFTSSANYCGGTDMVVYRLNGPGTLDSMTGVYTATAPGNAQVTAYSRKGKLTSVASVTVAAPAAAAPPPPPAEPPPAAAPPPPAPVTASRYMLDLSPVHFRFDHADLTRGGIDSVKAIADTLKAHPEVNVDLIGHTDWIGTEAYNMKLSRARAETVHRLLVKEGIADTRITVKWRGKDEPVADNKTDAGRALNRRVEVKQNN